MGALVAGDVLVSNFNNSPSTPGGGNLQGTGSTIVQVSPSADSETQFAHLTPARLHGACPGGVGLTTALGILNSKWVIVGSLPTKDGSAATAGAGCLILLDDNGNAVGTISGTGVNGPWDLTSVDQGGKSIVFVTNVIDGTVERIQLDTGGKKVPHVDQRTQIGSGFAHRADASALFIGPTGDALASSGALYIADSLANRIAAIPNALKRHDSASAGEDVSFGQSLNDPLGLTLAPNGDILTVNGLDGNIIETAPTGSADSNEVATKNLPPGAGGLFGLAVAPGGSGVFFVDDTNNALDLLH
ncbi:MAG: hypothetical protein JOY80_03770 [Candidatus Dormibacteraeota bacterium]|nr:hypothetical protein [Candidatus Dormibacteraeota bacterium]